jgi:uncharacterized protein (DUF2141 family)
MASPTATASLNKAAYAIGETMTLTVTYGDTDRQNGTVTFSVTDAEGNSSGSQTVPFVIDPLTVTVSSTPVRTWTKVSDTGSVAVFTAVA